MKMRFRQQQINAIAVYYDYDSGYGYGCGFGLDSPWLYTAYTLWHLLYSIGWLLGNACERYNIFTLNAEY